MAAASSRSSDSRSGTKVVASNRKARRDYDILDTVEAGIVLRGSEVKSMRDGLVQLAEAYARVTKNEVWLEGMHVSPYLRAVGFGAHDPDRSRKLLLHADEISRLASRVAQERLTLVPLAVYFKDGKAKVELALAKGRTKGDKRQALATAEAKQEMTAATRRAAKQQPHE